MGGGTVLTQAPMPLRHGDPPTPAAARWPALRAVHDYLAGRPREVMAILTEISTHKAAAYELTAAVHTLAGALDEVQRHRPRPLGRLAAFLPSNVLLYSYVLYLLVPALFTDRMQFRPASQVRAQTLALHDLLAQIHDLPVEPRRLSQRAFLRECAVPADVVVFTGSYQNAETIRPQLRREQLFLYYGAGINPLVVCPGTPLAGAVHDAVEIRMLNSGQDCLAPDLFLVHREQCDEFLELLVRQLSQLRFGAYDDPAADYGPIAYDGALEAAASFLCRHRDAIVYGGQLDLSARRMTPTVLCRELGKRPVVEEFFAPVFNVAAYRDVDTLAAQLDTGIFAERALGASVYGHAPQLVEALRRRHTVTLNQSLIAIDQGNEPFGGYGPMANYAAHLGKLRVEPLLISKSVADHLGTQDQPRTEPPCQFS